jgi:hypothetical protein
VIQATPIRTFKHALSRIGFSCGGSTSSRRVPAPMCHDRHVLDGTTMSTHARYTVRVPWPVCVPLSPATPPGGAGARARGDRSLRRCSAQHWIPSASGVAGSSQVSTAADSTFRPLVRAEEQWENERKLCLCLVVGLPFGLKWNDTPPTGSCTASRLGPIPHCDIYTRALNGFPQKVTRNNLW